VNSPGMERYTSWHRLVDLLLTAAGFGIALILYDWLLRGGLTVQEMLVGWGSSVFGFWLAVQLKDWRKSGTESEWVLAAEQFCFGTGVNLLLHALLTYGFLVRRTPFLIITGSIISTLFLAGARRWVFQRRQLESRVLMLGFDSVAHRIVSAMRLPLLGVIGASPGQDTADVPCLGGIESYKAVIETFRPTHLVVSMKDWQRRVDVRDILQYRLAGMVIEEVQTVYEKVFTRVCCERLRPIDLLLSSALRGDSRTMAIQAVYTNLVALFLLILLSPVLVVISIAVGFFSGPGPVFESIECAGFQYIPFRLLRFRTTRHDGSAQVTRVGHVIKGLRLANLPQLINIVRGDMALVGPLPVRREFASYLTGIMPFYSHRFSVKPGIMGWARMHGPRHSVADDCKQVEYDLYYIKEGSLWMDLEIFFRMLPGGVGNLWRKGAR
jgi:lipopolysaccharide/colanic/teichoic acid biosynthesis glycosyltransferase